MFQINDKVNVNGKLGTIFNIRHGEKNIGIRFRSSDRRSTYFNENEVKKVDNIHLNNLDYNKLKNRVRQMSALCREGQNQVTDFLAELHGIEKPIPILSGDIFKDENGKVRALIGCHGEFITLAQDDHGQIYVRHKPKSYEEIMAGHPNPVKIGDIKDILNLFGQKEILTTDDIPF